MSFPKPANHPAKCWVCHGTGWQPADPVKFKANGAEFEYTMLEPCTHIWWDDNENCDEHGYDTITPMPYREGRAVAARAYADECRRHGREPDWSLFDEIVGDL